MKFLIPTPDKPFYLWQILVQIANFREMGYEKDMHIPMMLSGKEASPELKKMMESKDLKCHFYVYQDDREHRGYAASMKPYMMYKYFQQFPERKSDVYNYLDSDVIFTSPMDFSPFINDEVWYGSQTKAYTGVKYVKSKGEEIFLEMCRICGVRPALVEANDDNHIGAQYFIKNNTPELWFEIYEKSTLMYNYFTRMERELYEGVKDWKDVATEYSAGVHFKYSGSKYTVIKDHVSAPGDVPNKRKDLYTEYKPIQKWTAEMWTTIYACLRNGIELRATPLMDFHWANHDGLKWYMKPYFHNAGLVTTTPNGKDFCKRVYNKTTPFNKDLQVNISSSGYRYVELIRRTEKYFPDLIW